MLRGNDTQNTESRSMDPAMPEIPEEAAPLPARCVDCGLQVTDELVFRVLRRDRAGVRHVVCQPCADRRHAEAKPTPLQVQRTPPRRDRARPAQE